MDEAALQALSDIVKNETTAGANTATRIGTLTESIIQNMGLGPDYRVVSCVLRNTGSGWFAIDDATHTPLNVDSVSNTITAIDVDYTSLGATEVVYGAAIADETFAGIYDFGTSVDLTDTGIVIKAIPRKIQILVTHNGSGSFSTSNWNSSPVSGIGKSYNAVNGELRLYHNESAQGVPQYWDMGGNTVQKSNVNTISETESRIKFLNDDGTQQTLADPEVIRFLYERELVIGPSVNPNDVISAGGNIWFFAIMKI